MSRLRSFASIAALLTFGIAPTASQQMREPAGAAMHTIRQPFATETFGIFRKMMLSGDFTPKVQLAAVMAKHSRPGARFCCRSEQTTIVALVSPATASGRT